MIKPVIKIVNKEEILEKFSEKYVENRWSDEFDHIDEYYKKNKVAIEEELKSKFDSVCKLGISLQEQGLKGEIQYIYFSLLRTSLLKNKGEFRIDLYDQNWFLDKVECSININLDFIYNSLFKHMEDLKEKKKEYGRTIRDMEIENIMLEEANKYHILTVEYFKKFIEKLLVVPSYNQIKRQHDINILVGEYMDATVIIYPKEENIQNN